MLRRFYAGSAAARSDRGCRYVDGLALAAWGLFWSQDLGRDGGGQQCAVAGDDERVGDVAGVGVGSVRRCSRSGCRSPDG
jgi:hypothetical protein